MLSMFFIYTKCSMICTVYAVVVPPMQRGTAYAHAKNGKCVRFTGDRAKVIALCDQVRLYNEGVRSRVLVETNYWDEVASVDKSNCFAHLELRRR
jgi:hypothetical protein